MPIGAVAVSPTLPERVAIGAAALFFIANAAVEVIVTGGRAPEREVAIGERIVDQLGNGAVERSHHLAELFAFFEIAEGVVMVVDEGGDPGDVAVEGCVVIEAIPEDFVGFVGGEGAETIADSGGDEIDGVVAVPVFEAVVAVEMFVLGMADGRKGSHGCPLSRASLK